MGFFSLEDFCGYVEKMPSSSFKKNKNGFVLWWCLCTLRMYFLVRLVMTLARRGLVSISPLI